MIHSETLNELEKVQEDLQIVMSSSMSVDGESCSLLPPLEVQTSDSLALHSPTNRGWNNYNKTLNMKKKHGSKLRGSCKHLKVFFFYVILLLLNVQKP
jgi:hypothetical protein